MMPAAVTALGPGLARLRYGEGTPAAASYLPPREEPAPPPACAFALRPTAEGCDFHDSGATPRFRLTAARLNGGRLRLRLQVLGEQHFYGLGHGGQGFDRLGAVRRLWNCHVNHGPGADIAVPLLLSSAGYGLFLDSAAPAVVDPGPSYDETYIDVTVETAGLDLYILAAPDLRRLLGEVAALLGRAPMPPRWALGYLQSTRHFESGEELRRLARRFRESDLACEALILLSSYGDMIGWNRGVGHLERHPAVAEVDLRAEGFRVVLHEYPVLHPASPLFAEATERGYLLDDAYPHTVPERRPAANYHEGQRWLDFARPEVGAWWWEQHRDLLAIGVDGWWLDGGEGPDEPDHNRYDLHRQQAFAGGEARDRPGRRPFLLCRSGGAGMQRFGAACWSGDVNGSFASLEAQIALGLNLGLSGVPYWGTDIGGYYPTRDDGDELFVRWFQFGAFCPVFRAHGRNWRDRLPWSRGPAVEAICRRYLDLRRQLLPYAYTLAWQAQAAGLPLMRPLFLADPADPRLWDLATAYLWGDDMLVAPVTREGATAWPVTLPRGGWHDFWTHRRHDGPGAVTLPAPLDRLPLLVRAGAILPLAVEPGSLTFRLYPAPGRSAFTLYEDDGETDAYRHGGYTLTECTSTVADGEILCSLSGPADRRARRLEILLPSPPRAVAWADGTTGQPSCRHDGDFLVVRLDGGSAAVRIVL